MNLRTVLREIGADATELDHLVDCDDCRVEDDLEGARVFRCSVNPITLAEEADSALRREGWALLRFMGCPPQPSMFTGLNRVLDEYLQVQMAEFAQMREAKLLRQIRVGPIEVNHDVLNQPGPSYLAPTDHDD